MKLEEHTDSLKFTVNILGYEKFGSTIFVRDAYKDLYNIIVWGQIKRPKSSGLNQRSYVVMGTPGKLTVNPFTHSLLILHRHWENLFRVLFLVSLCPSVSTSQHYLAQRSYPRDFYCGW